MADDSENEELGPSKLGTQDYWNNIYCDELENYKQHGDVGEIWFGEDISLRIRRWLRSCNDRVKLTDHILDVGCGNGVFLVELAHEGFLNLTGVDYSDQAIHLAVEVAKSHEVSIRYICCDFLNWTPENILYDIVLDKGTYDAVSLNPDDSKTKRAQYISRVWDVLQSEGLFIITSCNWTENELISHFESKFDLLEVIPTPTFKFGGKTGNVVSSIILKKK